MLIRFVLLSSMVIATFGVAATADEQQPTKLDHVKVMSQFQDAIKRSKEAREKLEKALKVRRHVFESILQGRLRDILENGEGLPSEIREVIERSRREGKPIMIRPDGIPRDLEGNPLPSEDLRNRTPTQAWPDENGSAVELWGS